MSDYGVKNSQILEARGLKKIYDSVTAVDDLKITLYRNEILALIGANGAGKSTLTKILAGETTPNQGWLQIDGCEVNLNHHSPSGARHLGLRVVHQELSLCRNLTVYENF
ncbi:MAG: ATP-binding cassette domain-containing protein, partial [Deltaproteobacteria bacterium]|nr:ATP-binding cassette domain-containing protein [Deltaproteobacteria bacterium]